MGEERSEYWFVFSAKLKIQGKSEVVSSIIKCEIERSSIELPLTIPLGIVKGEKGIREELGEGEFKGLREKGSLGV